MTKTNSWSWRSFIIKTILGLLIFGAGIFIFSRLKSSVTQNLDAYVYDLPFGKGTSHRVVQGYGGLFSHKHIAALDFSMPVGTPVYAAREGIIYRYKDDSDKGGPFPGYKNQANFIIIKHADGSYGCYWHLEKNGVVVKSGFVARGQLIGYSGCTGFVLSPHLHFSVKRVLNYAMDSFVRTRFKTTGGISLLANSESYERPVE
jgi:murein DD-endopeptidase MepM/ murein hydrolase activator NlpD